MNIAYIFCNMEGALKNWEGEGPYILVFNGEVIGQHFCSSRGWAEKDLLVGKYREEVLIHHDIDEVYSNGRLIWTKEFLKKGEENE